MYIITSKCSDNDKKKVKSETSLQCGCILTDYFLSPQYLTHFQMPVLFSCEITTTVTLYAAKIHSMHAWIFPNQEICKIQHGHISINLWLKKTQKQTIIIISVITALTEHKNIDWTGQKIIALIIKTSVVQLAPSPLPTFCPCVSARWEHPFPVPPSYLISVSFFTKTVKTPTSCLRPRPLTPVSYGRWSPTDVSVPQSPPLLLSGRAEAFSEDFLGWASLTRPGSLAQGRAAKTLCWENPTDRWSFIQHSCQLFACQPGGVKAKWECLSKTKWECLDCKYILHSAWRSCYSRGRIHGPPLEVWIDK